jgi:hypothetical protein
MGLIVKEYTVTGNRRSDTVRVLYDTGAGSSFVRRDIAEILGEVVGTPTPMQFTMADGQETFTVDQVIPLDVDVNSTPIKHNFYVADDLAEELIIGADLMQRFRMSLDMENEAVSVDPRALYLRA